MTVNYGCQKQLTYLYRSYYLSLLSVASSSLTDGDKSYSFWIFESLPLQTCWYSYVRWHDHHCFLGSHCDHYHWQARVLQFIYARAPARVARPVTVLLQTTSYPILSLSLWFLEHCRRNSKLTEKKDLHLLVEEARCIFFFKSFLSRRYCASASGHWLLSKLSVIDI